MTMAASDKTTNSRMAIIVMGVSGSGKSSIGEGLAGALGLDFVDGDGLHSPENVAKMASGTPLVDDDRWPWLDKIGSTLGDGSAHPVGIVVACSALKKIYRDRIRAAAGQSIRFVFLDAPQSLVQDRLGARKGHFMPPSLLASQYATLERPGADEPDVLAVAVDVPIAEIVRRAAEKLSGDFAAKTLN
ncbi:gluconokinase [Kaistia terrae]|uniref:Gluconokinase n=1 Tax=Kaistia terrae TaxID=537017 RepID=A0ABW0PWA7_9HYPH|nr:gluconokinase [Kaistia terrae]MCX5577889.1 gluconokinase [Kaistia terrae]